MVQEQIKHPVLSARLHRIRGRIYRVVSRLDVEMLKSAEPIPFEQLRGQTFTRVAGVVNWGRKLSCAWFRLRGNAPQGLHHPVLLIHNTGEGLVYSPSGEILDGLTLTLPTLHVGMLWPDYHIQKKEPSCLKTLPWRLRESNP